MSSPARDARIARDRAAAVDRIRGMEQWMDENRRQVVVGGVDLPSADGRCERSLGERVATPVWWAIRYQVPVTVGSVRRLRWRDGGWMALVRWDKPSLIPDCWLDADDLEPEGVAGGGA